MATNSNSDQGKIDNELEVIETDDRKVKDLIRNAGFSIGITSFEVEENRVMDLNNLDYEPLVQTEENKNKPTADSSSSNNTTSGGGQTIYFVDEKKVDHNMDDIINNPAVEIAEGKDTEAKKKEIASKASKETKEMEEK